MMKDYIALFLRKQNPRCIYKSEEKASTISYTISVWLTKEGDFATFMVAYTQLALIGQYDLNLTLFENLENRICRFQSYDEALAFVSGSNLKHLQYLYQTTCDSISLSVKAKLDKNGTVIVSGDMPLLTQFCAVKEPVFKLHSFSCINQQIGIFSALYSIDDRFDAFTLVLGKINYITCPQHRCLLQSFVDKLFEQFFKVEVMEVKYDK